MEELIKKIRENLDESVSIENYHVLDGVSINLKNTYKFYDMKLLNESLLLVVPRRNISIISYIKQKFVIQNTIKKNIVVYLKDASRFEIKELIRDKVDFFSDKGQFYLPTMNLNIKAMINKKTEDLVHDKFTPSMQLVYLYMLYSDRNIFSIEELSKKLELTNMTLSRITREFEKYGLITHSVKGKTGRKNEYFIDDKRDFYNIGKNYLVNPVKKEIYVKNIKDVNVYKNSLSYASMLNDDAIKTYAIYKGFFNKLRDDIINKSEARLNETFRIQLLIYNLKYLSNFKMVDPITQYLSIKDKDERVDKEFNNLMKRYKWYTE